MLELHILVIVCGAMILSMIMFFLGLVLSMGKTADLEMELHFKDKVLHDIKAELNNLKIEDNGKKQLLDEMTAAEERIEKIPAIGEQISVDKDDPERNLGYMEAGL